LKKKDQNNNKMQSSKLKPEKATKSLKTEKPSGEITVASFDIGVKNLAFCVMRYDPSAECGSKFPIIEWKSIDLTDPDGLSDRSCSKIKPDGSECIHGAKIFLPDGTGFCGVHNPDKTKYKPEKQTGAKAASLSYDAIGNALMDRLDDLHELWAGVDHVVLETQFNKNRRMIFLSAIIFAYFMQSGQRNPDSLITKVKFVSSRNKLQVYDGPPITTKKRKNPKDERKQLAIQHCEYMVRGNAEKLQYLKRFPKKKDDLSDCFLQGAWYLQNECKATRAKKKIVAKPKVRKVQKKKGSE
jgi:hypothetical protein